MKQPNAHTETLQIKCTSEQKRELASKAEACKTSISNFVRRMLGWPDAEMGNPRTRKEHQ